MAYRVPQMPILCNIWHAVPSPLIPPFGPPDLTNVPCNLALGKRCNIADEGSETEEPMNMWLLLPKATDIRLPVGAFAGVVEVQQWSGRYYALSMVDDAGGGFANEHRFALIEALYNLWPVPYPSPSVVFPPPPPPPGPPIFVGGGATAGADVASINFNLTLPSSSKVFGLIAWANNPSPPTNTLSGPLAGSQFSGTDGAGITFGIYIGLTLVLPAGITPVTISFGMGTGRILSLWYAASFPLGVTNQQAGTFLSPGLPSATFGFSPVPLPCIDFGGLASTGVGGGAAANAPFTGLGALSDFIGPTQFRLDAAYLIQNAFGTPTLGFTAAGGNGGAITLSSFA